MDNPLEAFPKVVIITGPDYLGKTWLVGALNPEGFQVIKRKLPEGLQHNRARTQAWATQEVHSWNKGPHRKFLVYDRFPYPDEAVYGYMEPELEQAWEVLLEEYGVQVVVVLPRDVGTYVQRLLQSRDAEQAPFARSIIANYQRFVTNTSVSTIVLRVDEHADMDTFRFMVENLAFRGVL